MSEAEDNNPKKPRQFYRYTYKDYLQSAHLTEDELHMHWQYWHENALKSTEKKGLTSLSINNSLLKVLRK